jgi:hypothetical protein
VDRARADLVDRARPRVAGDAALRGVVRLPLRARASAIFSLSFAEVRQVTVEVEPRSRRNVQARGLQNRSAEPRELDVLRRWLDSLADARRKPRP